MTSELKIDLRDFGYAEGMYMGKCRVCSEQFMGEKRSWSCKTCAEVKSLEPRQPRAVPDVPELVRYAYNPYSNHGSATALMEINPRGEYVRYDQAAAVIASLQAELAQIKAQEPVAYRAKFYAEASNMWRYSGHPDSGFDPEKYEQQPLYAAPVACEAETISHDKWKSGALGAVDAWEALPGGRNYDLNAITKWVQGPMYKAINTIRALSGKEPS